jgi:hypothetical protein
VVSACEECSFGRENDEGGELDIVGYRDRPAVVAVPIGDLVDSDDAFLGPAGDVGDTDATVHGSGEQLAGAGRHGVAGGADTCGLGAQEVFGLNAPREQFGVEGDPVGVEGDPVGVEVVPEVRGAEALSRRCRAPRGSGRVRTIRSGPSR